MTDTTANQEVRIATLKRVRLSFTDSLHTAKATVKDGAKKHGCNILIEPGQPETDANNAAVMKAIRASGEQQWGNEEKFKVIAEDKPDRVAFRKGERFKNQESQEVYKGYEGAMVIPGYGPGGSKSPKRPLLMDRRKKWIWNPHNGAENVDRIPDVFYSGVYADVKVEFYPITGKDNGGDGIFATIQVIRSREEGDRMAGGYNFTEKDMSDFDDLPEGDAFEGTASGGAAASGDDFG